jgi:hypothetical protein
MKGAFDWATGSDTETAGNAVFGITMLFASMAVVIGFAAIFLGCC